MSDAITIAIIGGLCTAVPSLIATVMINRKSTVLTGYRLDKLEKKMDEHNDVIRRTFVIEEQIKVVNHRIGDLERKEENR